jgi:hypothetical protein
MYVLKITPLKFARRGLSTPSVVVGVAKTRFQ